MRRTALLALAGVLAIQAVLTLLVFNPAPHTGGDNAGYIALAHSLVERGSYQELWDPAEPPHTKYPPVFPLVLAALVTAGVKGWAGLKGVSVVATLLAGLFAFLWARNRGGVLMGAGVAILLALSDGVLDYSRWILSDPLFLALTLGALWALERGGRNPSSAREGGDGGGGRPSKGAGAKRGRSRRGREAGASTGGGTTGEAAAPGAGPASLPWLGLGFSLVVLAYFTRSAGLPLVAATLLWLAWRRRWRSLLGCGAAFLLPAFLWWLRGRTQGGSAYVAEFWLVDPYRPDLGRIGVGGLLLRMGENLVAYATDLIPEGIVGVEGALLPPLGIALFLLALLGWVRDLRREGRVGELMFPLYFGLMLLWPEVWSGDRFALPLLPFVLLYSASGLLAATGRLAPVLRQGILALGFLVVALPSLANWTQQMEEARFCSAAARGGDPWGCYSSAIREYVALARWSGEHLPPDASVVTRKPRIFYVLSGVKARSLPLTGDVPAFLDAVREGGSRYLSVDRWDGLASRYAVPAVRSAPGAFCLVTAVALGGEGGTLLLGMPEGPSFNREGSGEGGLARCGEEMVRVDPEAPVALPGEEIPLLLGKRG